VDLNMQLTSQEMSKDRHIVADTSYHATSRSRGQYRDVPMKIIATLLVLCLAACGGSQISYRPPPTSNVVAFMGDSETARWNLPQFDTGGQTLNFGVPGDNTAQMLARFDSVIAAAPGVVVILGGINDLFEGSTSTY
jgi:hypothetical protein